MTLSHLIMDLQQSFAPLTCIVEARGSLRLAIRLVDRAGQQTPEYGVELDHLRSRDGLDAVVERIRAAIEADGFQKPAQPIAVPGAAGWLDRLRLMFRGSAQAA